MMTNDFIQRVAFKTLNLLIQTKAMHYTTGTVFYLWQRSNRIIVAFDPAAIKLERVNEGFIHDLSTRLEGRRVVRTNTRGLFLQVGLETPRVPIALDASVALDFSQQTSAWHLPVGMTENGPLWIPLMGGISFLIGGSTGMGKTGEEHAWIQALLHGGKTLVYAWDGKHSIEFMRYADQPNFHLMLKAEEFEALQTLFAEREQQLARSGCVNIWDHNEHHPNDLILPVALFVDEAADLPDSVKILLKQMIRIYRYVGLYPIIATNQPTQAEMFAKTNLSTRVAFRVPHHNDSVTMLGYKGAEALPDVLGRGLISWKGKLIEFQSFQVIYPPVSDAVRQLVSAQAATVDVEMHEHLPIVMEILPEGSEIIQLAGSIREQWFPSMSKSKVSQLLGKAYAGNSWCRKVDQVIEYLTSTTTTTTTTTENRHISPDSDAVAG